MIGTTARYLLSSAIPDLDGVPIGILLINVSGAFLLGFFLEALDRRGPATDARRKLRLFVGTGIIGGYTTYGTLVMGVVLLLHEGHTLTALSYATGTVVLGVAGALGGTALGRLLEKRS